MPVPARVPYALATALSLSTALPAQASTITEFLDRIGGCRRPMSESFSLKVSPYTPKPYDKALTDWTEQDLTDFRTYFVACQTRRPDWQSMGDYNRNDAIRVIDTAMADLRYKVGDARAEAAKRRANAGSSAAQQARNDGRQQSVADAAADIARAQAMPQVRDEERDEEASRNVIALSQEVVAFVSDGYKTIPADQLLPRIDSYLARARALSSEVEGTSARSALANLLGRLEQARNGIATVQDREAAAMQKTKALLSEFAASNAYQDLPPLQRLAKFDNFLKRFNALRPEITGTRVEATYEKALHDLQNERATIAMQAGRDPANTPGADEGPYTDYEWLGQRGIMALTNPLQREGYRASLARGIDFNVGVSSIERAGSGWLVQLSGRLGVPGKPGQGFYCRVEGADAASLGILRGITPPYGIIHAAAPDADEFLLQGDPLRIRIVFSPCRVTAPDNGEPRRNRAGENANPVDHNARAPDGSPVAPSPANLRCSSEPSRRGPEQAMAHRIRQAWAIPEALRDDRTLTLTFAVTLNFDAEMTGPVQLLRSISKRATAEQLQAAVETARRAISDTAPFPELGQLAGGTMQIDMTPCD
ncbi:hypothetical protein [Methylobacterium brachythecii]|nr:hypothetical protein [Methylobacterium brachythecii]MBB3903640.1 hypothetical protein [Methylobacterium brachythecii]